MNAGPSGGDFDRVFRTEHGRVVATLVRYFGDIDIAEDAAQEAYLAAVQRWPGSGIPPNPGGWLTTTARNRAIDRIHRDRTLAAKTKLLEVPEAAEDQMDDDATIPDERLELVFTCCHPALATSAQAALTLRLLGGLTTAEIASAFLVDEAAMAKRLTRSKQKIKAAKIPYRVPADHELPARLRGVLATLYLIFNEGYLASAGDALIRTDLCTEAIRLARVLASLMPDEPEVAGLLALMLLTDARRDARIADGVLVPLPEQDRGAWNRAQIREGHHLVRSCLRRGQPGPYQILAAINAVHTDAATAQDTDWAQIVALYDQLYAVQPTPVVALNRAVAVAELDGPDAGLALLEPLDLAGYHPFQASRADLLRRAGRVDEAWQAYQQAIELAPNPAERAFLRARLSDLSTGGEADVPRDAD